ncbi:MAG TPA: bifunctional diaminohydroxyphosphoribosylaminopyrimidine deaminase/5-amino-6-(5-phosphoribosylamino)uracil reductase RibD [Actinomycetales bacterium]|nr:bifunctional diaminohydroxyphosphoribosylaminopyrimidine deaminase/5-amino-6-(5-phosphoribosylamino)uracil reductase RibD [Actinomycetales bacterium]
MTITPDLPVSGLRFAARNAMAAAARSGVTSPNPQVGCVILDDAAHPLITAFHSGAGAPHAEAAALAQARAMGIDVRAKTAVVTLEPCAREGRTPPCANALVDAGLARVIYLVADPTAFGGGAQVLAAGGIEVFGPARLAEILGPELELANRLLAPWLHAARTERPYVVAKFAATLDGRIAAADGTSRWITGARARDHVHQVRAQMDGIIIGTGTALTDDPSLTVRLAAAGSESEYQPRRIVIGKREIPSDARLRGPGGELIALATHDIDAALAELFDRGLRHVVVEGGSRLLAEFFRADAVNEVHHYLAPAVLGAGAVAVADFGATNISQALRWHRKHLLELSPDLLQVLTPSPQALASAVPGTWQVTDLYDN